MEERKSAAITRRKEGNVNAAPTAPMATMSMAPTAPITMSMAPTTDTGKDISRLETLPSSPTLLPHASSSSTGGLFGRGPNIVGWMLPEDVWTLGLALLCLALLLLPPFRGFEFPLF